jgi:hypothetical protein
MTTGTESHEHHESRYSHQNMSVTDRGEGKPSGRDVVRTR